MDTIVKLENIRDLIFEIRTQKVILDSDIAGLYSVTTRDINKAVKNNKEKFPDGYVFKLTREELTFLRGKFSTTKLSKTRVLPKAFSEKGLYMLATILSSKTATKTTLAIIETFAKIRELSRNIHALPEIKNKANKKVMLKKSGEIAAEIFDDPEQRMKVTGTETSIEINFAVLKFKRLIKHGK